MKRSFIVKNYNLISILLIILSIFLFFLGFYLGENSAGAGSYSGDFSNVWKSLNTFLNHGIIEGIGLTAVSDSYADDSTFYYSSRTPLIYILNTLFNPFVNTKPEFLLSIFVFSLTLPVLFYYFVKTKFKEINPILCLLISSIILFSPYFRTSSYWGLEENYGLISSLASFIFLQIIFNEPLKKNSKKLILYFFLILFSSLCVYFDHKLLIVPLICFFSILFKEKDIRYKIFSVFLYLILSLPFMYFIKIWGGILPTANSPRLAGQVLHFIHPGYVISIIAFYLFPLIFFKEKRIDIIIKEFFKSNFNKNLFFIFILYLILLFLFNDFSSTYSWPYGRGVANKIVIILFKNILIQEIFTYLIFLLSFFVLLIFFNENKNHLIFILYFLVASIFILPLMQEYYDPIIFIFIFAFFSKNFKINYKSIFSLYFYYLFFLISANIYYQNLS